MKMKKSVCAVLAAVSVMGTCALAKDNIYAYNKFVSTVLGPTMGYCDFTLSFAGHENEYQNVNDYYPGLISAFYQDIDGDLDNELITVDTHGVTVYQAAENGVVFLGSIDYDLIANYGDSYSTVFTINAGGEKYIGIESYGKAIGDYYMFIYRLDPETDELGKILELYREENEDGTEEKVWAYDKTYYSYTNGGGLTTSINPEHYEDMITAAEAALTDVVPELKISRDVQNDKMTGKWTAEYCRFNAEGSQPKTYIKATGIRLTDSPVVYFEDNSELYILKEKPDLVTVVLDGQTLQFPTQDPIIIDGRTLVPMRTIFEALGADVEWIDENGVQSIVATTEDTTINMTINSEKFYVNGEEKELDVPPQLINDKTLVPIRAISESLGCYVGWDQDAKTVLIQSHLDVAANTEDREPPAAEENTEAEAKEQTEVQAEVQTEQ